MGPAYRARLVLPAGEEATVENPGPNSGAARQATATGCAYSEIEVPARLEVIMIILGVILLVIGYVASIAILWTIGIILIVIGLILWILGAVGHAVGGRRHYW